MFSETQATATIWIESVSEEKAVGITATKAKRIHLEQIYWIIQSINIHKLRFFFSDKVYLKKKNLKQNVITIQHKGNKLNRQHCEMVAVCARAPTVKSSCWWFKVTHQLYTDNKIAWWKDMLFFKARGFIREKKKKGNRQTTKICLVQIWIIIPTRPHSIWTSCLNILAVLESIYISLHVFYETKTRIINNKHSHFHPVADTRTWSYQTCMHARAHTQHWSNG